MRTTTKTYQLSELEFIKSYRTIDHIGLPKIVSVKISESHIDVEFEYVEGIEISEYYLNKLSTKEIETDFYKLCAIVKQLHKVQIIHRDIKPSNIIKGFNGEIYLIDFDISRIYNEQKSKDTRIFGTEYYAAPEQYGFGQTDQRTCIYQIGATFKELTSNQETCKNLTKKIEKCCEFDPIHRYQTMDELISNTIFQDNLKFWLYFFMTIFHAICISIVIDCYKTDDIFNFFFYLLAMPICDTLVIYFYIKQKSRPQKMGTIAWKSSLIALITYLILSASITEIVALI